MFELHDVSSGYGANDVLRSVQLKVPASSVVALLGSNGAGKTTLLRTASRLVPLRSGSITLDGVDVSRWSADRLASAGVCHVPEGRGIFRQLTVRENLRLQVPSKDVRECLDHAIGAFPALGDRLDQLAGTLSGGEQQMLAIARAYVLNPRVLLLDEVSMGLAPIIVDQIFESLAELARQGVSLLLVEQYVTKALELADYVFILDRGRVAAAGEASEFDEDTVFAHYLAGEVATG